MSSFSDVPMKLPEDAPTVWDTFEAKYVTRYLEEYVDSHVYDGSTLRDRIRVNAEVQSTERTSSGWTLHIKGAATHKVRCQKLIVASGLTSSPNMPTLPNNHDWKIPILHHRDFGLHSPAILAKSLPYQSITVLGGGKSAADMVYASIKAGKNVDWIIRKSGEGPGIFMNPEITNSRYRHAAEAGTTRNATALNPSAFRPMAEWAQKMHQEPSERENLEAKLFASDRRYKAWANYKGREGALPGFRDLEPTAS